MVVGSAALPLGLEPPSTVGLSCPLATLMPMSRGTPKGNRTYFPFFSDFRGHNVTALRIGESSALGFIFLLSLAGNVWGICLLVRRQRRLLAANCLVLNLFCADLLFITAMPFIAVVRWTESWELGDVVCHLLFYVMSLSGAVIILSLTAVSLERVLSIARLRHAAFRRRKVLVASLLLIWSFAALFTLPLCCFFTVVRPPAPASQVRASAGRARGSRAGPGRGAPGPTAVEARPPLPRRHSGQRADGLQGGQRSACRAGARLCPELPRPLLPALPRAVPLDGRRASAPMGFSLRSSVRLRDPLCSSHTLTGGSASWESCPAPTAPSVQNGHAQIFLPNILKCIQKCT